MGRNSQRNVQKLRIKKVGEKRVRRAVVLYEVFVFFVKRMKELAKTTASSFLVVCYRGVDLLFREACWKLLPIQMIIRELPRAFHPHGVIMKEQ